MKVHGLGVDIPDTQVDGRRQVLIDTLAEAQSAGYTLAELSIPSLNIIINGELIPQRVEAIRETLALFDLRYSVHAPGRTNLAFGPDTDMEYRVLEASVRFCGAIGARLGRVCWSITAACKHWTRLEAEWRPCQVKMNWRAGRSERFLRCANWRRLPEIRAWSSAWKMATRTCGNMWC